MKCRKCGSGRMYGNGWRKARSVHTHIYRCYDCGAQCNGEKRPVRGYVPITLSEHSRRVSMGLLRYYKEAPAEKVAAHKKAVQDGLARRRASAPPREKEGFIGMLGDIEVYAIRFSGVGRPPQGLPAQWVRTADGKAELKKLEKRPNG